MRYWLTSFILLVALFAVQAHEFWLQADRYFLKTGERVQMKFMVGENFMGDPWDLKAHGVVSLVAIEADVTRTLTDSIDRDAGMLSISFAKPGTKLLAMQSDAAFIELEPNLFNEYLKEDGLDDVYAHREKNKLLGN